LSRVDNLTRALRSAYQHGPDDSVADDTRSLETVPYRSRVRWPGALLVVAVLLAAAATVGTAVLLNRDLETRIFGQLAAAGRLTRETMVRQEERQLAALRPLLYTTGVNSAVATGDVATLERLLAPIAATIQQDVDVFSTSGGRILTLQSSVTEAPFPSGEIEASAPVRAALTGGVTEVDRFADVVAVGGRVWMVTTGPVVLEGRTVGTIAVRMPIDPIIPALSRDAGGRPVSLYWPDGQLITSTVKAPPEALVAALTSSGGQLRQPANGEGFLFRSVAIANQPYLEAVGALTVRGQPRLLIGVGTAPASTEQRLIQGATLGVWLLLGLGLIGAGTGLLRRGPFAASRIAVETRREMTLLRVVVRPAARLQRTATGPDVGPLAPRVMEWLDPVVARHGGQIEGRLGDSTFVSFQGSAEPGEDARKAVLAVLELVEHWPGMAKRLAEEGLPAVLRVSADSAPAYIGPVGAREGLAQTLPAHAVDVTRRLLFVAEERDWDAVISRRTLIEMEELVEVGEPWSLDRPGAQEPELAYPVIGLREHDARERRRAYYLLLVRQEQSAPPRDRSE
jgi:class 3 adenylate cyclase